MPKCKWCGEFHKTKKGLDQHLRLKHGDRKPIKF